MCPSTISIDTTVKPNTTTNVPKVHHNYRRGLAPAFKAHSTPFNSYNDNQDHFMTYAFRKWLVVKLTLWERKACRNAPFMFGWPPYIWTAPYVWMPPYFWMPNMIGHTHMFGCPLYVWTPPICLDASYVWTPLYVWMPPCMFRWKSMLSLCCVKHWFIYVLDTTICLDAPHMFGHPHMFWWQSMLSLCLV